MWVSPIPEDWIFYTGLVLFILGLLCIAWLIFYIENSRDLPPVGRTVGAFLRLVVMSVFMGFGTFLFSLVELI